MIRNANLMDAPRIHELLKNILQLHKELYPERFPAESKYSLEEVESLISDPKKIVYVYEEDRVEGYVIGILQDSYIFVDDLCVAPSMRGKAVGEQLMDAISNHARSLELDEIQLNVWEKNTGAIRFYEKLEFVPLKRVLSKKV